MRKIVDIARDPNGLYIGRDGAGEFYWFHVDGRIWIQITPEDYDSFPIQC